MPLCLLNKVNFLNILYRKSSNAAAGLHEFMISKWTGKEADSLKQFIHVILVPALKMTGSFSVKFRSQKKTTPPNSR